jgi:hypothetical protein
MMALALVYALPPVVILYGLLRYGARGLSGVNG